MKLIAVLIGLCIGAEASAQAVRLSAAERTLWARIIRMGDTRTLDTAAFDAALRSRSSAVRGAAVLTLGQLGRTEARPRIATLRHALADPSARVASRAAYALGLVRDTASIAELSAALARDTSIADNAAWALGQIGEPARAAILAALQGNRGTATAQLLLAASKLRPVPVDLLPRYLASSDESVRWAAAYAIARPRVSAGVRLLLGTSRTSESGRFPVAAEVARGLARAAAGDSLADTAYAVLVGLLRHQHPHVRINAVRSLATYDRDAIATHVIPLTRDRDANVRVAAAQALAALQSRHMAQVDWETLIDADTSLVYRRAIYDASLAHQQVPDAASQWQRHRDWNYRAAAAAAAPRVTSMTARNLVLATALADRDPRVRAAAVGAIAGDTLAIGERRTELHALLRDPSERVRAGAISALARLARAEEVPAVLGAYAAAERDRESDARVAAISYVGAAWRRDSASFSPELLTRLRALPAPADPVTRASGRELPFFAAWRAVRISARPVAWYRDVVDRVVAPSLAGRAARATIGTIRGPVVVELVGAEAPLTVHNFVTLARRGFYNGAAFHRVVPNFVVQDGDPTGTGSGGPGYSIRDELNPLRYVRGVLGMALSGPDTGGSQWFITHSPQPHLDGGYTAFGRVVSGFAALDSIVQGDVISSVTIR